MAQYPELHASQAEVHLQSPLPAVLAHEPSLTQAISNLLSNAVKFAPSGVKPTVRL